MFGFIKKHSKTINYQEIIGYLEEENSSLENFFHLNRTKASFFNLNVSADFKEHAHHYKELQVHTIDTNLFTLTKKIDRQFFLVFASIAIEQYVDIAERLEREKEKDLIDSIQLKLSMNTYKPRSKDIFKITEPTKNITCGELFEEIGRSSIQDSIYFAIKEKIISSKMPKLHLEQLLKLIAPVLSVSEDGLCIQKHGTVLGTIQSLGLSRKISIVKSPKSKSGSFPFHLMARWATKLHNPKRINLKKVQNKSIAPQEDQPKQFLETTFLSDLDAMDSFFKFKYVQKGTKVFVIIKILPPSTFKGTSTLEIQTYK